jgi:hypothetical protein
MQKTRNRPPLYMLWCTIKNRCYNAKDRSYLNYGAKGITMSDSWKNSYNNFFRDMGEKPTPKHTIDRIDGLKGYSKENCRWATQKQQQRNRLNNKKLSHEGEELCLEEWAEKLGINHSTILGRLKRGWPLEKALTIKRSKPHTLKTILAEEALASMEGK